MVLKRYFSPDDFVEKYEFIDVEYMNMHNKKVIISDLDNTLISWDSKKDTKELNKWLKKMKKAGFDIIVVSNNTEERVKEFCKKSRPSTTLCGRWANRRNGCRII